MLNDPFYRLPPEAHEYLLAREFFNIPDCPPFAPTPLNILEYFDRLLRCHRETIEMAIDIKNNVKS
jgi:hypothetical protein